MPRCARVIAIVVLAAGLTGFAHAQEKKKSESASVAGRWAVTVKSSAHGETPMGLVLKQNGKKITGTFSSPHGDHAIAGEFVDGALKFATTDGAEISFSATLRDDGTLAGYLSSQMGDMRWTAERVKE